MTVTELDHAVPAGPRARRWHLAWLAFALLALVLGGTWHATGSYAPLTTGSTSNHGLATVVEGTAPNREVYQLPFSPGTDQLLRFSVRNSGRWAVTVEGVQTFPDTVQLSLRQARAVQLWSQHGLPRTAQLPTRLGPGEELELEAVYRIGTCGLSPDSGASYDALKVRWHAFGRQHVSAVPEPIVASKTPPVLATTLQRACPIAG